MAHLLSVELSVRYELEALASDGAVLLASQPCTDMAGCCLALACTPRLAPALSVADHCFDASTINKKIPMAFSSDAGLSCALSV